MSELKEKLGVDVKGTWKKESITFKLKDTPMSRRAIELSNADGTEMRIRSIKIGKLYKENNKFIVELDKFVPAK